MSESEQAYRAGHIEDVGFLDLRYARTEEDLAHIKSLEDVGLVLIPEHLAGYFARVRMEDVGVVVPVPQDCKVNCMTGQVRLTGEALAAGDANTILLIAGQAFVSGEVTSVGYKEIRVYGQFFAPRESKSVVSAKITQLSGQNFFLPAEARMVMGKQEINREFLELLPEPSAFVIMGEVTFNGDVSRELLQSKIPEIVLMGKIVAPKQLQPLLEVITKEKMGEIVAE